MELDRPITVLRIDSGLSEYVRRKPYHLVLVL